MSSPAESKRKNKPKHMDRAYNTHAHDLTSKDSQPDTTQLLKKPYLKKRSGLFRFYKCLPSLLAQQEKSLGSHSPSSRSGPRLNEHENTYPLKSTNSIPLRSNINNINIRNINASNQHQNRIMLGHNRSTTYNASNVEVPSHRKGPNHTTSDQSLKEEPSGVEIYEILDTNNGTEKYRDSSAISSRYNLHINSNFEQGDVQHLSNYPSTQDVRETESGNGEFPGTSSSSAKQMEAERQKKSQSNIDKEVARSFTSPRDASTSSTTHKSMNQPIALTPTDNFHPHDNLIKISSIHCGSGDEDEEEQIDYHYMTPTADVEETDAENLSQTSDEQFRVERTPSNIQSFLLTSQIAELHGELMTMKNKVALLEKNAKEEGLSSGSMSPSTNPTQAEPILSISREDTPHRLFKKVGEKSKSNYQATIESIQNGLERIGAELNDIQTGFVQKMESLEEEIHIKSQRWCENQIKMADKVHSLFAELEILANSTKAQQHQVQNLAENVEKEFEAMRSDWKDTQGELEKRIQALEEQNVALVDKLDKTCSTKSLQQNLDGSNSSGSIIDKSKDKSRDNYLKSREPTSNRCTTTTVIRSNENASNISVDTNTIPQPLQVGTSQPMPNSGRKCEGSQVKVSPKNSLNSTSISHTVSQDDSLKAETGTKIESIGGQIISARKTLPNGDIETVYTNGTREIIKADKSEVRHMYRNGDVRTVAPDGTVTYFYAESSTWQTTYPTGVELFKFPNGVIERRLPNGLIEQTDIDGRVTFFQATPPKAASSLIPTIAPIPVLKPESIRDIRMESNPTSSVGIGQGRLLPHSHSSGIKLGPGERVIVFENGEEEIHGPDYRKRIFADGTVKTVYQDGSQETRYPNGRIRIKDGDGNLVADVTVPDKTTKNSNH